MLRIVGVMRRLGQYGAADIWYLFDAQNRWGYEARRWKIQEIKDVYLFDAQNRWGYEAKPNPVFRHNHKCIYSMLRIVGVMSLHQKTPEEKEPVMYLFDAQNRWGYEFMT